MRLRVRFLASRRVRASRHPFDRDDATLHVALDVVAARARAVARRDGVCGAAVKRVTSRGRFLSRAAGVRSRTLRPVRLCVMIYVYRVLCDPFADV